MLHTTINFTEDGRVNLVTYLHEKICNGKELPKKPAIIILPGGAYAFLSDTEAEPVALTFMEEGYQAFVLNYSVGEYSEFPNPLDDVSRAIWMIREHAEEWGVDADAIVLMGFSAGSGIAALSATQWNTPGLAERLHIPEGGNKPNAVVLGYGGNLTEDFFDKVEIIPDNLGKIVHDKTPQLNYVNYVGPHVPPLFIWHCRGDKLVPSEAPAYMALAMEKYRLPYEMHVFQFGAHGISVANQLTPTVAKEFRDSSAAMWVPLCVRWMEQLFGL